MRSVVMGMVLVLGLSGCSWMGWGRHTAQIVPPPPPITRFLDQLGVVRGVPLTSLERFRVSSLIDDARYSLKVLHKHYLQNIGDASGLDVSQLGSLTPALAKPIANPALKQALEARLGHELPATVQHEVEELNQNYTDALTSIQEDLVDHMASKVGVPASRIEPLLVIVDA
ncbi:MAG: hypothetical protein HKM02_12585 [Pseudomonadales bacterium]|nr:hypothetical protein [Pseudomonadales bacterium]